MFMKFQQDACCVAESIFIITRKSSEVVMLVIFRHDADPIHKTRMRKEWRCEQSTALP